MLAAPPIIFAVGVILWACLHSSGRLCVWLARRHRGHLATMGFLLVCMGDCSLLLTACWNHFDSIPDRPRCAEKSPPARYRRRAFLCDRFRSGAADGLPALPASDGISSATRPARPAPGPTPAVASTEAMENADSPGCRPAPGAYGDIKNCREQRHGDVGGIGAEANTFTCMPETDNHDRRRC